MVLQWKSDLVEYTYTLPYLKEQLLWPDDKEMIDKIAGKFYECVKSYMLMVEYVEPEKEEFYKLIWSGVHHAHDAYSMRRGTREAVKEVFVQAYLKKFI